MFKRSILVGIFAAASFAISTGCAPVKTDSSAETAGQTKPYKVGDTVENLVLTEIEDISALTNEQKENVQQLQSIDDANGEKAKKKVYKSGNYVCGCTSGQSCPRGFTLKSSNSCSSGLACCG